MNPHFVQIIRGTLERVITKIAALTTARPLNELQSGLQAASLAGTVPEPVSNFVQASDRASRSSGAYIRSIEHGELMKNLKFGFAIALLAFGAVSLAVAQEYGTVQGTAVDTSGAPLPGVTVVLTGQGAPRTAVTDANGVYRFLGLDPGTYGMTAELDGFSTVEQPVVSVNLNRTTTIQVTMSTAVEETITVTSESPLLDPNKITQGTAISNVELEKIPTARDPWAVLNQTPGVLVDRINVGGNESGQQSVFRAPGASSDENDFLVDGVQITDMAAVGASPTYYDFDQFEAMEMSTGGTDVTKNAAGVSVNIVTKRGSNEARGSARFNLTEDKMLGDLFEQSTKELPDSDLGPNQSGFTSNSINKIEEYGFEAGGPVIQDKLWLWGSYGVNDVKQFNAGGGADDTILRNTSLKINAQPTGSNSLVASWNVGDKNKFGRGAGPSRSTASTWDQRGPTDIYKFEDTHVFSNAFYLTGQYSKVDGGFSLTTKGGAGPSAPETVWGDTGVWENNYLSGFSQRPAEEVRIDASYFFNTGSASHEFKFGGRQRDFESFSPFGWPGRNIVNIAGTRFGEEQGPADYFFLYRAGTFPVTMEYFSLWAQDTISFDKSTLNIGLRFDDQSGANGSESVPSSVIPAILPGVDVQGGGPGFDWASIEPRIGYTYALGDEGKTLLRASASRFAEQMSTGDVSFTSAGGTAYAYFYFVDGNDDNTWQDSEEYVFLFPNGFDPSNPSSSSSPNSNDPGLDPPVITEIILGIEHALRPNFVIGGSYTMRNRSDIIDERNFVNTPDGSVRLEQASDYELVDPYTALLPNGSTVTLPQYALRDGFSLQGGAFRANGDRETDYTGFSFNFTKRLSNRWGMRGFVNVGDADWSVPGSYTAQNDPNPNSLGSDTDGALFIERSSGSGRGDIYLESGWQANLNGIYLVAPDKPWGFNVAANVYTREGYVVPYNVNRSPGDFTRLMSLVGANNGQFRTDDPFTVDFRIEKEFAASSNASFTFGLDIFNALNERTVLAREPTLTQSDTNSDGVFDTLTGSSDNVQDVLSARIYRLGVRVSWR